jgi:hypothetical protein
MVASGEAAAWTAEHRRKQLQAAEDALRTMKTNPAWQSTAGCTDVSSVQSKRFCALIASKEKELEALRTLPTDGKVGPADAQAVTLAWLSGGALEAAFVQRSLPVLTAIVFELCAALSFFAASSVPLRGPAYSRGPSKRTRKGRPRKRLTTSRMASSALVKT